MRRDARLTQPHIQHCPTAGLSLTIHDRDVLTRQIGRACNAFGVPTRHNESLLPLRQRDHDHAMARQFTPDVGEIVFTTLWIPEVCPRRMRVAASQHPQGGQTPTLDPQKAERGIAPGQVRPQQFQGRVTPEDDHRVLQELRINQHIDRDTAVHCP